MSSGCIRERGLNRWEVRYEAPRGPDGRRRTRTETIRGSKRDAQRRLRELLGQVDRGVAADAGKMTVGRGSRSGLPSADTRSAPRRTGARRLVRLHLVPALGAIPLARLAPVDMQRYLTRRSPPAGWRQGRAFTADRIASRAGAAHRARAGAEAAPDRGQPLRRCRPAAGRARADRDTRTEQQAALLAAAWAPIFTRRCYCARYRPAAG